MTSTLMASWQINAVAMSSTRPFKTFVNIMAGSSLEGKSLRAVAAVAANSVQAMSRPAGSLTHTFIDVETDSFHFIITRMAFTPVSTLQVVTLSLNAGVAQAAFVQVSTASIRENISWLTHAFVTASAVNTLPKEATRIFGAFIRVNTFTSLQGES